MKQNLIFTISILFSITLLTNTSFAKNDTKSSTSAVSTTTKSTKKNITRKLDSIPINEFENGDIIFHTSKSRQSQAIMFATKSEYSHVGIIQKINSDFFVLEAIQTVSRTPLRDWIMRGKYNKIAVYRYNHILTHQQNEVVAEAEKYLGKPYDLYFNMDDQKIYCSELVYKAYKNAKLPIGELEKVSDLVLDNEAVTKLITARAMQHPVCLNKRYTIDRCIENIKSDEIITPAKLAEDSHLIEIFNGFK